MLFPQRLRFLVFCCIVSVEVASTTFTSKLGNMNSFLPRVSKSPLISVANSSWHGGNKTSFRSPSSLHFGFLGGSSTMIKSRLNNSRIRSRCISMSGNTEAPSAYDHTAIELKWQKHWEEKKLFKTPERRAGKTKKYVLDMFPYPSGSGLHVGHPEGYTATDIMARYWRMKDYDVLHPMGWDSFGLPAEQHAINTGTHPEITTFDNIDNFRRQLKMLGFSYDWDREVATTDWDYVKWTQWIFLQLYKKGLANQSEVSVNWCPALGTVLANEEVIDGKSERGDHPVVRMPLRQWVFKITEYATELEADLSGLDWPEGTMTAQKGWIGRSEGASIKFDLNLTTSESDGSKDKQIEVFTTRPDTIMGVTYLVLAPEHPLVDKITTEDNKEAIQDYVLKAASKSDMDRTSTGKDKGKSGVFTGAFAKHPLTGKEVPVWIADYVLWGYGTGAVMAVPGHDERDYEFAKIYTLPILQVVKPTTDKKKKERDNDNNDFELFSDYGISCNSGEGYDNLPTVEMKDKVISELENVNKGKKEITYRLRDWVFSRQRYWGEPIPIFFPVTMEDPVNGDPRNDDPHTIDFYAPIPVEESDLPLKLPEMSDFKPGNDPQGCLARAKDWRFFQKDLEDGKGLRWFSRETNTMPQWAGSCWYYLRFTDPKNMERAWSEKADKDWLPVDLYVGGQEHAVLHLLYARFWHKVLYDIGMTKHKEPFQKLIHQGMILGTDGEKMSKSRGNVINPDDVVNEHGADALRMYEMFMGPLEATKPWQTSQVSGVVRFRDKVYAIASGARAPIIEIKDTKPMDTETITLMHQTIKKVGQDIDAMSFNTAISTLMIFTNKLWSLPEVPREAIETLVLLVSPFAPHVAEECWQLLGHSSSLSGYTWPLYIEELTIVNTVKIGVQVNGKVRGEIEISKEASEEEAKAAAMELKNVVTNIGEKEVKKFIYKPGKIVSFVIAK